MAFNSQRKPGLYRRVGLACGLDLNKLSPPEADRQTIDFIRKLNAGLGLAEGLRASGVKESQIEALTNQAFEDQCHLTNPVPVKHDDLKALYLAAL
jgi:alcohol dehydrogenase class IV